ncbi:MAG: leucine-rich repeat domain-containing protein, partial [Candidatus Riesia sp.]|nr:leucine-rich repeat domain-containing protein [Candidatus Riesia sp.]
IYDDIFFITTYGGVKINGYCFYDTVLHKILNKLSYGSKFSEWMKDTFYSSMKYDDVETVSCPSMNFDDLKGVWKLRNLKEIYCFNNNLTTLDDLRFNINLKVVSATGNKITELSYVKNLKSLEKLWLSKNKIESIEGLEELKNLNTIDFSNNNIKTAIDTIKQMDKLTSINLFNNKISHKESEEIKDYCRKNLFSFFIV